MKNINFYLTHYNVLKIIMLIMIIWLGGLGYLSAQHTTKQKWEYAEIISGEGKTIHKWQTKSFVQFISQRVCSKNFLVINSDDPKILQLISPSSVFDVSTIRSFEQVGKVEQADSDSTEVVYKLEFKSLNYPERLLLFTNTEMSFMLFMTNRDIALVLYNNEK